MNFSGFYTASFSIAPVAKWRKKSFSCLWLLFIPWTLSAQLQDTSLHIYILAGQSNMAGRGLISAAYKEQYDDRVLMFSKDHKWVKAEHPLHFDKPKISGVGPGLAFGMAMANANNGVKIGLVPCAVGGTPISSWEPGAFDKRTGTYPFDDAILRIKEAKRYGVIKGIIWHQGEADSRERNVAVYLTRLQRMINRFRSECGDPELPFIAGEIGRFRKHSSLFNQELSKLPLKVSNTLVISSEGLWHKGDSTHFDSPSAAELGRRYAAAMLRLQGISDQDQEISTKKNVNRLSKQEKMEGWQLLFDGKDPGLRWRSLNSDEFPKEGWEVRDGALVLLPGKKGGDIITREQFSDFELSLEYKLSDSANTGIKYFVNPLRTTQGKVDFNGPEYQLIDDYKNPTVKDNKSPITSTGSLYLLYAPQNKVLNPPGAWNALKIVARGKDVEHWLNGKKILTYRRGSDDFKKRVAETKFNVYETPYGEGVKGAFLLQDQNREAWFRNIKVMPLE